MLAGHLERLERADIDDPDLGGVERAGNVELFPRFREVDRVDPLVRARQTDIWRSGHAHW